VCRYHCILICKHSCNPYRQVCWYSQPLHDTDYHHIRSCRRMYFHQLGIHRCMHMCAPGLVLSWYRLHCQDMGCHHIRSCRCSFYRDLRTRCRMCRYNFRRCSNRWHWNGREFPDIHPHQHNLFRYQRNPSCTSRRNFQHCWYR